MLPEQIGKQSIFAACSVCFNHNCSVLATLRGTGRGQLKEEGKGGLDWLPAAGTLGKPPSPTVLLPPAGSSM